MDASIEPGFYVDPDTKKMFYVIKKNQFILVPPWVKSKPSDWRKLKGKEGK